MRDIGDGDGTTCPQGFAALPSGSAGPLVVMLRISRIDRNQGKVRQSSRPWRPAASFVSASARTSGGNTYGTP